MAITIFLDLNSKGVTRGLTQARTNFKRTADAIEMRSANIRSGLLGTTAALAGVGFAIKKTVDAASELETVTTQYEVMTGSIETAKGLLEELLEFSATTPFQFGDIAEAGRVLMAFGVEAKNVRDRLQQLGDVAAVTGVPLKNLSQIFGKARLEGKLTAERLNQLQDRGINVGPAIADAFRSMGRESELVGVSLKKLAERGKITFDVFDLAFQSLSQEGGPAFEGMIKRSKTLQGLLSTLGDNIQLLFIRLGNNYLPQIKAAAIATTQFIASLKNNQVFVDTAVKGAKLAAVVLSLKLAYKVTALAALKFQLGLAAIKLASINVIGGLSLFSNAIVALIPGMAQATTAARVLKLGIVGLAGATGIGLITIAITELMPLWTAFWKDSFATAKVFITSIGGLAKGMGKILVAAFKLDPGGIRQGWLEIKNATAKGVEEVKAIATAVDTQAEEKEQADAKLKFVQGIIDQERQIRETLGERLKSEDEERLRNRYMELTQSELNQIKTQGKQRLVQINENQAELDKFESELGKARAKNLSEIYKGQYLAAKAAGDQFNAQNLMDLKARYADASDQEVQEEARKAQLVAEAIRLHREGVALENQIHTDEEIAAIKEAAKAKAEAEGLSFDEQQSVLAGLRSQLEEEKRLEREEQTEQEVMEIYGRYEKLTNAEVEALNLKKQKMNKVQKQEAADQKKSWKDKMSLDSLLGKKNIENVKTISNAYAAMSQSKSEDLRRIAKAGALTNIAINTADTAMAVFASTVELLKPFGPWVAIPAAIAATVPVIAFGAEQTHKVLATGAQEGGLVTRRPGTPATGDHQPFLLEPGEVVLPKHDVKLVREASMKTIEEEQDDDFFGTESPSTNIMLGFEDNAASIIEAKNIENQAIGIGVFQNA